MKEKNEEKAAEKMSPSDAISYLEKKYGDDVFVSNKVVKLPVVSSGCLSLDFYSGINGFPFGRIIEVFGQESSGKTTLALTLAAQVQKQNKMAVYVDVEHSVDLNYAKRLGVNLAKDLWQFTQPDDAEQALDIADSLVKASVGVVIIDSVAALSPRAELEGEMDKETMGLQARIMGKAMRKLKGSVNKNNVLCIFINQVRDKIGGYGGGFVTPGGKALKFYASMRIEMKGTPEENCLRVTAKFKKNKIAPPHTVAEFKIANNGTGIMIEDEIVEFADKYKLIEIKGAWVDMKSLGRFQGRNGAADFLKKNPILCEKFREKILDLMEQEKLQKLKDEQEKEDKIKNCDKEYENLSLDDILAGKKLDKKKILNDEGK